MNFLGDDLIEIEYRETKRFPLKDFLLTATKMNEKICSTWTDIETETNYWINALKLSQNKHLKHWPIYASDQPFSLFPSDLDVWNLDKFTAKDSTIHDRRFFPEMAGITSPFLYIGMDSTAFGKIYVQYTQKEFY